MVYLVLVIAVLAVLFYFVPKRAAIILSVFAVIIFAIAMGIYWHDLKQKQAYDKVAVTLAINKADCPQNKPLGYSVNNQAEDTTYRIHFYYNVYREGYSTAISRSYRNEVTIDKIIPPGESHQGCVGMPEVDSEIPESELRFELDRKRVWFEPPVI